MDRCKVNILKVPVDKINMNEAIYEMEQMIKKRIPSQIVTPNSIMITIAQKNPELLHCLKSAQLSLPDGIGVVWGSRILKDSIQQRVTGIDFMMEAIQKAEVKGYRVFFLGSKDNIVKNTAEKLQGKYSNLKIAGYHHGYFSQKEEEKVLQKIKKTSPHILFVGMGVGRQELWVHRNLSELNVPVAVGVGGSFDVVSGKIKRAPFWMQKAGLEWLYRFIIEPKRFFQTYLLFKFIFLIVFQQKISYWIRNKKNKLLALINN